MPRTVLHFARTLAFIALCFFSAVQSPAATELRLKNGDTLRGEHVKTQHGLIHFKSPVLGTILIPATDAKVVDVADMPIESLVGLPPLKPGSAAKKSGAEGGTNTATAATLAAPPSSSASLSKTAGNAPKSRWKGKVEFGYQQQSGRKDSINGSLRVDVESHLKTANLFKASGRALYGRQNDQTNSERYEASFRWRHEFGERMFTQTLSSYLADRVKRIDHNYEQNAGLGYRFLQRERHVLNAGLGGTGQYREGLGSTEDVVYLNEFFQDYSYKINGRLSFLQESGALYSTTPVFHGKEPADNYRLRFNTALQGRVSERVSLNLRYEYEYDNTIASPTLRADQRITSSIGYAL
jgi:putative salt-induced outer membrane protein YdiY